MSEHAVNSHYGRTGLWEQVAAGLQAAGKNPQRLTVEELAPLDQFHTRGRAATLELAQMAGIKGRADVLDAGGGVGGTARTLASLFACHVTVLDVTDEFCAVGRRLTAATGLTEHVHFQEGSATAMPIPDSWFDYVFMQHLTMNIADKEKLYQEVMRVLRPGGRLAMHEIMAGSGGPIEYPVPWARTPDISDVRTPDEMRQIIQTAGLREIEWWDETPKAVDFFKARAAAFAPGATPPAMGIQLLVGADSGLLFGNLAQNFMEGRLVVVQAVFEKPGAPR